MKCHTKQHYSLYETYSYRIARKFRAIKFSMICAWGNFLRINIRGWLVITAHMQSIITRLLLRMRFCTWQLPTLIMQITMNFFPWHAATINSRAGIWDLRMINFNALLEASMKDDGIISERVLLWKRRH